MGASISAPANAGDWAYQSTPVDITSNGNYTLDYGPVDDSFDFPKNPGAVVFDFPSDMKFLISPFGRGEIATINGHRYFRQQVQVSKFKAAYSQLTGWIY